MNLLYMHLRGITGLANFYVSVMLTIIFFLCNLFATAVFCFSGDIWKFVKKMGSFQDFWCIG